MQPLLKDKQELCFPASLNGVATSLTSSEPTQTCESVTPSCLVESEVLSPRAAEMNPSSDCKMELCSPSAEMPESRNLFDETFDEHELLIPPYDGEKPMAFWEDILDLPLPVMRVQMRLGHFPDHWIRKFTVAHERKSKPLRMADTKRRDRAIEAQTKVQDQYSRKGTNRSAEKSEKISGSVRKELHVSKNEHWRIPFRRNAIPGVWPRPTVDNFSPDKFKQWVDGVAVGMAKGLTDPRQYVSGNDSCRTLYYSKKLTVGRAVLASLLEEASVYVGSYKQDPLQRRTTYLSDFLPKELDQRVVVVSGVPYTDPMKFAELAPIFSKNKVLFKLGMAYLINDGDTVDIGILQRGIDKKFPPPVYQGKLSALAAPYEYQGWFTVSHEHHHKVSVGNDDVRTVMHEVLDTFSGTVYDKYKRPVVQALSFVVNSWYAETWQALLSSVTLFVSSSDELWKLCEGMVTKVKSLTPRASFQGLADDVKAFFSEGLDQLYELLTASAIYSIIIQCMGDVKEWLITPVMDFVKGLRSAITREATISVAKTILEGVVRFFQCVKRCFEQRSLQPLWGERWDPEQWLARAETYITYYPTLTANANALQAIDEMKRLRMEKVIPESWTAPVSLKAFTIICQDHFKQGLRIKEYFSSTSPPITRLVETGLRKLTVFIDQLALAGMSSNQRIAPFSLMMTSKPGTGKSVMCRAIAAAVAAKHGYDQTSAGVFDWDPDENFQSGLDHNRWCIVMDDPDISVAPEQAGVKNHCQAFMSIRNNKPLKVEEANANMKGRTFATPMLLFYLTNFRDALASKKLREPKAFWRRVDMYLVVEAKPEFSRKGAPGELDPNLAEESDSHDMYRIGVSHYDPAANFDDISSIPVTPPVYMSFPDFMVYLHELYDAHMEREVSRLKSLSACGNVCPQCFLPADKDCGHGPKPLIPWASSSVEEKSEFQGAGALAALGVGAVGVALASRYWRSEVSAWAERIHQWRVPQKWDVLRRLAKIAVQDSFKYLFGGALAAVFLGAATIVGLSLVAQRWILQGREENSLGGLLPSSWLRMAQDFRPGLPPPPFYSTYTKEDLIKSVCDVHVEILVDGVFEMHAVILCHNALLVPSHALALHGDKDLSVRIGERVISISDPTRWLKLSSNSEISIVRCADLKGTGGLIGKIWQVVDESVQQFDELEIWSDKLEYSPSVAQLARLSYQGLVIRTNAPTRNSNCGMLYVARFGKAWKIVGMHYAGANQKDPVKFSIGGVMCADEIRKGLQQLGTTYQGVSTVSSMISTAPEQLEMRPFPLKSEVWAAYSRGARPYSYGEVYPKLKGSTMKSNLQVSLVASFFRKFEEEACGSAGYWQIPSFKGAMVDGVWESPFTDSFSTQNLTVPSSQDMWYALADFLGGLENISNENFRELSEEETVLGVPGAVNAMNFKTSVGPPYNMGKINFMAVVDGVAYSDPRVLKMMDELEEALDREEIPRAFAVCALKDEALKPGKLPRVFNCLPAAYNLVMKKYMAPIKACMKVNWMFFECMVGINMTSVQCNRVVEYLKSVDPDLNNIEDWDVKRLDKSWNGEFFDFVALVFYAIAHHLGIRAMRVFALIHGLKHTIYCIKNDLFNAFFNPSGNDATVEVNSILMSLGVRFVFYKLHPELRAPFDVQAYAARFFSDPYSRFDGEFRKRVALVTYGDDALKSSRESFAGAFEVFRDELGLVVTDGDKGTNVVKKSLAEVQFLKRKFVWDEELRTYLPPLSKKSIARMLVIKKYTTLSQADNACVVMTEALREMVYHGREAFEELLVCVEEAVVAHNLRGNGYLRYKTYDEYREMLKNRNFSLWDEGVPELNEIQFPVEFQMKSTFECEWDHVVLEYQSATPQVVNVGGDAAKNDEVISATTSITHGTGQIVSASGLTTAPTTGESVLHQQMPHNDIADFVSRMTEIAQWTIADSDAVGVNVTIDPWYLFLQNPRIADKIANYTYIRGVLEVLAVVAVPGNAYGAYVVSALPDGGESLNAEHEVSPTLNFANVMQVDHFARIDVASAENLVLQLPWMWRMDYAELPLGPRNAWKVSLSCLSPVRTAIPGGVTVGSIKVYARLMPGYDLVVPHFQGASVEYQTRRSGHLVASDVTKNHAPALHAKLTKAKGVVDKAEQLAETASKLPIIGPYAATAAKGLAAVKKVSSWFGFSREEHEQLPMSVFHRTVTNVAHIDGDDASEMASLSITNQISIDPTLVGGPAEDCSSYASLFNRWTLAKRMSWASSAAANTVLGDLWVSPMFAYLNPGGTLSVTPAGFVGYQFQFWRGDMEYLIVIPASKLHRGSLQIFWAPLGSAYSPGVSVTNSTLNYTYDVATGEEKIISVGYAKDQPYSHTEIFHASTPILPVGGTNGRLIFRVINPLTSQNNGTVDILVFQRAGENMDFGVPRNQRPNGVAAGGHVPNEISYQLQGASGDEDNHEAEKVELVSSSGAYPGDTLLFGEKVASVRALMQKPMRLWSAGPAEFGSHPQVVANGSIEIPQFGYLPRGLVALTYGSWFRTLFTGLAGSERFKVFVGTADGITMGACSMHNPTGTTGVPIPVPTLTPMTFHGPQMGAEWTIPYYYEFKWQWGRYQYYAGERYNAIHARRSYDNTEATASPIPSAIYHSFGPDLRFTNFRQVPLLRVTETYEVGLFNEFFNITPSPDFLAKRSEERVLETVLEEVAEFQGAYQPEHFECVSDFSDSEEGGDGDYHTDAELVQCEQTVEGSYYLQF